MFQFIGDQGHVLHIFWICNVVNSIKKLLLTYICSFACGKVVVAFKNAGLPKLYDQKVVV